MFADIKKPVNPATRVYYPVKDNKEPIIAIGKDKEVDSPSINIFFKQDITPDSAKNNVGYFATQYVIRMITSMLDTRLDELVQTATPPFTDAGSGYNNYFLSKTKDAFSLSASWKDSGIADSKISYKTEHPLL